MEKKTLEGLTEEQISFQLILHSGNARSKLLQSLKQFREGHETVASDLLKEAEDDLRNAHDIHFQMVQQEASGETISFSFFAHACRRSFHVNDDDKRACGRALTDIAITETIKGVNKGETNV